MSKIYIDLPKEVSGGGGGDATAANQVIEINHLSNIDQALSDASTTNSNSDPAFNTVTEIIGGVTPSGLRVRLKITNATVTDTRAALPLAALTGRNSIIIENRDPVNSIFIGENDVTNSGAAEGWEVPSGSSFSTDITDAIIIYAIAPAGQTVNVKIMELA